VTSLSDELQTGKAAEHFVCCDLILQGYSAFLADQGLPYDVLVDMGSSIARVQVKGTLSTKTYGKAVNVYRFGTRRSKGARKIMDTSIADCFAFVALDILSVAYWPMQKMLSSQGGVKQTIDFKTSTIEYSSRSYSAKSGRLHGKQIEDFSEFPINAVLEWIRNGEI
jgi:hypothetical protein